MSDSDKLYSIDITVTELATGNKTVLSVPHADAFDWGTRPEKFDVGLRPNDVLYLTAKMLPRLNDRDETVYFTMTLGADLAEDAQTQSA